MTGRNLELFSILYSHSSQTMETKLKNILGSFRHISLEPVFLLFAINIGLISISSQSIYIDKACKVNLNETKSVCDNIQEFNQTQKDTQKYVSGIQAYNGALQVSFLLEVKI